MGHSVGGGSGAAGDDVCPRERVTRAIQSSGRGSAGFQHLRARSRVRNLAGKQQFVEMADAALPTPGSAIRKLGRLTSLPSQSARVL